MKSKKIANSSKSLKKTTTMVKNNKDRFLPVVVHEANDLHTLSEPLRSSATGAPGLSIEIRQQRGGSVADGTEDVIG